MIAQDVFFFNLAGRLEDILKVLAFGSGCRKSSHVNPISPAKPVTKSVKCIAVEQPHVVFSRFQMAKQAGFLNSLLNSFLFYWYYSLFADCEHGDSLIQGFPLHSEWVNVDWISQRPNVN